MRQAVFPRTRRSPAAAGGRRPSRALWTRIAPLTVGALLLAAAPRGAAAQASPPQPVQGTPQPAAVRTTPVADPQLGPGDVLQVSVFEAPDLNAAVRIRGDGSVSLPLLGSVQASGMTPAQLEEGLEARLRAAYIRDPHVTVQVTELQSRPVAVMGAVREPGVFQLRFPQPLSAVLAMAGGVAPEAGTDASVQRADSPPNAPPEVVPLVAADGAPTQVEIRPGDVVTVGRAGVVYLVGEANRPGAFPITRREPLTVLRVIALGGGLGQRASQRGVRVIRTDAAGQRVVRSVDLGAVAAGRIPDLELQAEDVVFVPNSAARTFALGAVDALVRMVTLRGAF